MERIIKKIISMLELLMLAGKSEADSVKIVLSNVDKSDPRKREPDRWDEEFKKLVPVLHNYAEALDILNRYGHLCDQYFAEIAKYEPQKMLLLQICICRVSRNKYTDRYICRYPFLLFKFLQSWDLLPEVKQKLKKSPEYYRDPTELYNKFAPEYSREQI